MAVYTNEVIVLGSKSWGDADKLLWLFSRDYGKMRAVAYGARRAKSPLAGSLQMFNLVDVTLNSGERLDTVRQATIKKRFKRATEELEVMAYASFVAELVLELSAEGESKAELFDELLKVFSAFEKRNPRLVALSAAYKILKLEGLSLVENACVHCGELLVNDGFIDVKEGGALCSHCKSIDAISYPFEAQKLILLLEEIDLIDSAQITVKKNAMLVAEKILLTYLVEIIEKPLRSLEFIKELS